MFKKTNDWFSMGTLKRNDALCWGSWDSCHLESACELDLGGWEAFPGGSEGKVNTAQSRSEREFLGGEPDTQPLRDLSLVDTSLFRDMIRSKPRPNRGLNSIRHHN